MLQPLWVLDGRLQRVSVDRAPVKTLPGHNKRKSVAATLPATHAHHDQSLGAID
jgi:hypothetical protein